MEMVPSLQVINLVVLGFSGMLLIPFAWVRFIISSSFLFIQ